MKHVIFWIAVCLLVGLSGMVQAAGGGGQHAPSVQFEPASRLELQLKAGQWDAALATLAQLRQVQPGNADWWNWTGYAERKRGNLDAAFPAYYEALRLDPRHLGAHEYLGEAYLQARQRGLAEEELRELERLCGHCEQQQDLARALADQ